MVNLLVMNSLEKAVKNHITTSYKKVSALQIFENKISQCEAPANHIPTDLGRSRFKCCTASGQPNPRVESKAREDMNS